LSEWVDAPNHAVVVDYVFVAHEELKERNQDRHEYQRAQDDGKYSSATPS
jgi:hypothetical protein